MPKPTLTGEPQPPEDAAAQETLQARGPLPEHVAIIMDGNGRWAEEQDEVRAFGHREGVRSVRDITEACAQLGIPHLTLYTFSTENWERPDWEVNALMGLLVKTVRKERERLLENGVCLRTLGDTSELPSACRRELEEAADVTAANERLTLSLALSYSGRWDLVEAAREIARRARAGDLASEEVDDALVGSLLSTGALPDPDLLIRTGGEQRLSNFLLWEMAYAEMRFTERYWPAFRRTQLYEAVRDFQDRDRRFGRVATGNQAARRDGPPARREEKATPA
ncbi:MAG: di-trans,poly-cis-decaprenylcistransferase [Bacteroidetes bacterium QS_8_68_28]|nr:MAG: di-trans,poly-cis-decaprenylcistransferase [Bacteroidetes bacterium QS_8_68_28]